MKILSRRRALAALTLALAAFAAVMVSQAFAGGKDKQWIQVGVSDLTGHSAEIISTERVEQMHLPAAFVRDMRSVIARGTTVLVTQASVSATSTGQERTVLDADDSGK